MLWLGKGDAYVYVYMAIVIRSLDAEVLKPERVACILVSCKMQQAFARDELQLALFVHIVIVVFKGQIESSWRWRKKLHYLVCIIIVVWVKAKRA